MDNTPLITALNLSRRWGSGDNAQFGILDVDVTIGRREFVSITGPSGSGKSTLGALMAGIDQPTSGSIVVDGERIDRLRNAALARWRAQHVGIVFQDFHLLPTLTAVENVALALEFGRNAPGRRERRDRAADALGAVGLAHKLRRLPSQLSGGEQQRVAIARAIVTEPALIVADEPTGSLDQASSAQVIELLAARVRTGSTVLVITHDTSIARGADRRIEMLDGRVCAHWSGGEELVLPGAPTAGPHTAGGPIAAAATAHATAISGQTFAEAGAR